jgi:hypothetical protein
VEFRKEVTERIGLGFELPSRNTVVGPSLAELSREFGISRKTSYKI